MSENSQLKNLGIELPVWVLSALKLVVIYPSIIL